MPYQASAGENAQAEPQPCAKSELARSLPVSGSRPLAVRGLHALKTKGLAYGIRRAAELAHLMPERPAPVPVKIKKSWPRRSDEALGLITGETVEVKTAEEIQETLDAEGRYKGLLFMDEMWKFCGGRFGVLGPIDKIYSESTSTLHSGIRHTVLLDTVNCDGESHGGCGARCYHLWREVWLRRPAEGSPAPLGDQET